MFLTLWLTGCGDSLVRGGPTPRPTRTPLPAAQVVATAIDEEPVPGATLTPVQVTLEPGWEFLAPGMELRTGSLWISSRSVEITVLRIDPAHYDFRVHADLSRPVGVAEWQVETGAAALINGAFFEPGDTILGLLVEQGRAQGEPFEGHGGMLTVGSDGIRVRSILAEPLQTGEQFEYLISGRPMLLYEGGIPAEFNLSAEASRRTVVAQDRQGRILFIVNDYGAVSLYKMRDWLATSPELNVSVAFNLDGGGSTGMSISVPSHPLLIDSWWAVASVLAVYPKEQTTQ